MWEKKVKLDRELHRRAAAYAGRAGYASVAEFVNHLLERELAQLDAAEDDDALNERLKGLGYIS